MFSTKKEEKSSNVFLFRIKEVIQRLIRKVIFRRKEVANWKKRQTKYVIFTGKYQVSLALLILLNQTRILETESSR